MTRIHLLLADMPPMLGDIISVLAEDPRLEIVARIGPRADLDEAVRSSGADVVLMSERMDRSVTCAEFLRRHPLVRLLTLSGPGDRLQVCQLVPHEAMIRDVSPRDLLHAILGESGGVSDG